MTDENTMPEPSDRMVPRHRRELSDAIKAAHEQAHEAERAAQATIRADAAEVVGELLHTVQQRVAGGAVAVVAHYGAFPPELAMDLKQANEVTGDEPAVVVCVPRPDRYGHTARGACAVIDVSNIYHQG